MRGSGVKTGRCSTASSWRRSATAARPKSIRQPRVKKLADKFCPAHENDRLAQTIASFVIVVSEYRSEPNSPPSPWETHQKCAEQALKATYPRKLVGCADSTCKALSEEWASDGVKAKTECLKKKLG